MNITISICVFFLTYFITYGEYFTIDFEETLAIIILKIHFDTGYSITCIVDGEFDPEKMTYKINPDGPQTDDCILGIIHCITATNGI